VKRRIEKRSIIHGGSGRSDKRNKGHGGVGRLTSPDKRNREHHGPGRLTSLDKRNREHHGPGRLTSPDKRNREHHGPGRLSTSPDKRNLVQSGVGRNRESFPCDCGVGFFSVPALLEHVLICPNHDSSPNIPTISHNDIKATVEMMQEALQSCRRQTVCAICDEIKPPEAVGHQVLQEFTWTLCHIML
jgi:hypothetical protein